MDLAIFYLLMALFFSPFWLPIAFLVYVAAKRRISLRLLFIFMTAEAISLGIVVPLVRSIKLD